MKCSKCGAFSRGPVCERACVRSVDRIDPEERCPVTGVHLPAYWSKVSKGVSGECWIWTGYIARTGYGRMRARRKPYAAHRLALWMALGRPLVGMVLHSCDVPLCVNPEHLREGTQFDNMRDMVERGRHRYPRDMRGRIVPLDAPATLCEVPDVR